MSTLIFNKEKTLNAVLYILNGEKKDFMKIFKLMYFADKEHLSRYGRTITGETYIAMAHGPVPTNTYDIFKAIKGLSYFVTKEEAPYQNLFDVQDYFVTPKVKADLEYLSGSDIEVLDEIIKQFGSKTSYELSVISHDSAWHNTMENCAIKVEDIISECNIDQEGRAAIVESINCENYLLYGRTNS